jgi:hypothetical protein
MTLSRSKKFKNQIGTFQYITVNEDYYSIGIRQEMMEKYTFLIASPEKALCDMITATPRLYLQSIKAVAVYLEDDLRLDIMALREINAAVIKQCMATGKKQNTLKLLLKLMQR